MGWRTCGHLNAAGMPACKEWLKKKGARRREEDGRRLQSGAGSVIVPEAALSGTTPIRPPNATADCRNASAARYSMWSGSKRITWRTKECCIFTLHRRRVRRPTELLIVFNQPWTCSYSGMIKKYVICALTHFDLPAHTLFCKREIHTGHYGHRIMGFGENNGLRKLTFF